MEHLEHLTGTGQLFEDKTPVLEVQYTVDVYRDPPIQEGLKQIVGTIRGSSSWDLMHLVGKSFTLHLEDGRKLECLLKNADGAVVGTGGEDFCKMQD